MKFLWNNKPAKIKFSVLINELEDGGRKLFDPISFCESLEISWVKRIFEKGTSCIWNSLAQKQFESVGGNLIWQCNFNDKDNLLKKITSSFLSDLLVAWAHFKTQYHEGTSPFLNGEEVIWNNSGIKINGKSVFYKHWYRHGIYKVYHIMDGQKNFLSFSAFQNKYPMLTPNFLEYMGLISAMKKSKLLLKNSEKNALSFILKQEKVCKNVHPFIKKPFTEHPSKCIEKWQGIFPNKIFN